MVTARIELSVSSLGVGEPGPLAWWELPFHEGWSPESAPAQPSGTSPGGAPCSARGFPSPFSAKGGIGDSMDWERRDPGQQAAMAGLDSLGVSIFPDQGGRNTWRTSLSSGGTRGDR